MGGSEDRDGYHHGHLAEALVAHAVSQVRDVGAERFSLRGAARALGVDPAAVYRHFRDKGALLGAVALQAFERMEAAMRSELDGREAPEDRVRAVGRAYVRFATDEPELFRLMFGPYGAGRAEPLRKDDGGPYALLLQELEGLGGAEALAWPLESAGMVAWSAVHGLAALVVDGPLAETDLDQAVAAVLDVTLSGLRQPGDSGARPVRGRDC